MSEAPQSSQPQQPSENADKTAKRRVSAPKLPPPGAITASPHTGSGPHKAPPVKVAPGERPSLVPRQPRPAPPKPQAPTAKQESEKPKSETAPVIPPVTAPTALNTDPATVSMLMQLLNQQRQTAQKFYMVVLPDDGWPSVEEFNTVVELVDNIKQRLGQAVYLFPFLGQRLIITKGEHKFLQTPLGALPLFDIPDPTNTDETTYGWVGDEEECPQVEEPEIPAAEEVSESPQDQPVAETVTSGDAPSGSESDTPVF